MSMSSTYSHSYYGPEKANDGLDTLAITTAELNAWIQAELPKASWIVKAVVKMRANNQSKT